MNIVIKTLLVGIGATFAMDVWSYILSLFRVSSLDYRFVGRWVGNFSNGKFFHNKITDAAPIKNELALGWASHYFIGIAFAFLFLLIYGKSWFEKPTLFPAILIGLITIVAPFFLMQPAFGLGVAGANVPEPDTLRLKSFMAHLIYGIGLYLSAILMNYFLSKNGAL